MSEVTQILSALERGEGQAAEQLLPLVYTELRRLAGWLMAQEHPGQTLQATALVHEAWIRVSRGQHPHWEGRRHFFAAVAEAMRRILVDKARRRQAIRHGGGLHRTDLDEVEIAAAHPDEELLAVHESLDALAVHDPRKAELVKLRYFADLTLEEAAVTLGCSVRTAKRDWAYARAWLFREIARRRA
jgi:RNA polymerase sigma factor (TIGR02999 family)